MRRRLLVLAVLAAPLAAIIPAAHADSGSACVHAHATVNGTALVDQDQCTSIPPALPSPPPPPALP
jgi:hypothetical protein